MFEPVTLGQYTLLTRLAVGGMAELFIAHDDGENGPRLVVVKRVLPQHSSDASFIKMFIDEARTVSMLKHPNIVALLDFGSADDSYFIAMEYIEGFDLATLDEVSREREAPFGIDESVYVIEQVCRGLTYAHGRKDMRGRSLELVHRDISPENIMISTLGAVMVTDFGIAKTVLQRVITGPGVTKGKRNYMSPESVFKNQIDHRHDVFTVGIVLWQLLTGRTLLGDERKRTSMLSSGALPRASAYNREVDETLDEIVAKALTLNIDDRYQSTAQLGQALTAWLANRGFKSGPLLLSQKMQRFFGAELERRRTKLFNLMDDRGLPLPPDLNRDRTLNIDITDLGLNPQPEEEEFKDPAPAEKHIPWLPIALAALTVGGVVMWLLLKTGRN